MKKSAIVGGFLSLFGKLLKSNAIAIEKIVRGDE